MEHEVTVALVSMAGGIVISLIAAFSAMMVARNTSRLAARKREVEDLAAAHRAEIEELARKAARKTELTALKLRINQLEKENARLKRRIADLDMALKTREA